MTFTNPYPDQCCFHWETVNSQTKGLHPLELKTAERFRSDTRKDEFLSGRRCAQAALREAGIPLLPVFRNKNRSPGWPFAMKGSIGHGAGIAAAIICKHHSNVLGIGMDVEDLSRNLKSDISNHILTPGEKELWGSHLEVPDKELKLIFSIKEAVYKCLQPIQGIFLGFHDAEVLTIEGGEFSVRLLKSPLPDRLEAPFILSGRLSIHDHVVLSCIMVNESVLSS
jgi:enterobactin synthetase component D / holo-[acyl-carrier protein] synthase